MRHIKTSKGCYSVHLIFNEKVGKDAYEYVYAPTIKDARQIATSHVKDDSGSAVIFRAVEVFRTN